MCVDPVTVPNSSLCVSPPQRSWPICLPGLQVWSHRSGPCQPYWDKGLWVSGCACVCASICYNWGSSCDTSPLTPPLWGETYVRVDHLRLHAADVVCVHSEHVHISCVCIRTNHSSVFSSISLAWPHPNILTHSPQQPLPNCVFCTRWGARVTSEPPLHCDWWDSPAQSPPSIVPWWASDTTWAHSLRKLTPTHLSFLISLPISVILKAVRCNNSLLLQIYPSCVISHLSHGTWAL